MENEQASLFVVPLGKRDFSSLAGFFLSGVVYRWPVTPKRARTAH